MKKEMLEYLRCPECRKSVFDVTADQEDEVEIREGVLNCIQCHSTYRVRDAILDMVGDNLPPEVKKEKEHAESHDYIETEDGEKFPITRENIFKLREIFLTLPKGDGSSLFRPGGSFDNQGGNATRFFETLEMLELTGKEHVLEVGASFGWASWRFAQKGCKVTALELSNYLHAADLYFEKDNIYFDRLMSDMSQLPFADNTFDIIFSHSVIHHCKRLQPLFSEFHRVLRPGGRVVALHECAFGLLEDKSGGALQEAIDQGFNENAFTIPEWKKGARDGGFKKVWIHYFSFIDDYVDRKRLRKAPLTGKLKLAKWIHGKPWLNHLINWLSILPRIILRPKNFIIFAEK